MFRGHAVRQPGPDHARPHAGSHEQRDAAGNDPPKQPPQRGDGVERRYPNAPQRDGGL